MSEFRPVKELQELAQSGAQMVDMSNTAGWKEILRPHIENELTTLTNNIVNADDTQPVDKWRGAALVLKAILDCVDSVVASGDSATEALNEEEMKQDTQE